MITENDILLSLYHDNWFKQSKSLDKVEIHDKDGKVILVPKSYYHTYKNGEQILIRVSEHGTSLNTWVKRRNDPTKSVQNLSVVFTDQPVTSNEKTEKVPKVDANGKPMLDKDGNIVYVYKYFVVEQYVYRMDAIGMSDFIKVIKKVKNLDSNTVFTDPLKKKPSKFANRTVLQSRDMDGNKIPTTTNAVHPRQTIVANNKDNEVDAKGNVLPENKVLTESKLRKIICEVLQRILIK